MLIGAHVSRYHAAGDARPGIVQHIKEARRSARAHGIDMRAAQIFVGGPRERAITLHPDERAELKAYIATTGMVVVAHSAYAAAPWGGDPGAARYIRAEAQVCVEAGIAGLVVHLPKAPLATVARYARRIHVPGMRIYLETPAVTPAETYYETPAKLGALFAALRAQGLAGGFGLCVDSAHLWVSGVDLRSFADADAWLAGLDAAVGDTPVMVHLNDAAHARGVGPDAHAALGHGHIWRDAAAGDSGIAAFVAFAARRGAPVILERKPLEALAGDYLLLHDLV